jgi:hypothetical protein
VIRALKGFHNSCRHRGIRLVPALGSVVAMKTLKVDIF